jgi:hypothetical protein
MSSSDNEPSFAAHQRSVQRKLGRCLIRLQQVELLVKALWIDSEHECAFGQIEEAQAAQAKRKDVVADKTLGTVLKLFLGAYVAPDLGADGVAGNDGNAPEDDGRMVFRYKSRISMSEESYAQTVQEFDALVSMRNDLVHHFIERFNLWSDDGCDAAEAHLDECYQRIEAQLSVMHGWAKSHQEARATAAAFAQSDEFLSFLRQGKREDGSIDWRYTPVVLALREAESNLAKGGWTSVGDAVRWLEKEYPDEKPALYGCSRWRHLLHESGLFEIQRFVLDQGDVVCFRSKNA